MAYEFPWTPWSVARIYDLVAKNLQKIDSNYIPVNSN